MLSAKATAPGKLILSGEHSVVYGAPAIAVAVNKQVEAVFQPHSDTIPSLVTFSSELYPCKTLEIAQVDKLEHHLNERFHNFINGNLPISSVVEEEIDLLFYTYAQAKAGLPGHISLKSNIPLGAGMGSSAAVIASVLALGEHIAGKQSDKRDFFNKVRFCERLQHGRGSALDAAAVTFGGLVKVHQDEIIQLPVEIGTDWYHLNTGTPVCSTGETVEFVRQNFAESTIWQEFTGITERLCTSLHNDSVVLDCLRENQRLLKRIGVVPERVVALVESIERCGGAAKISGAGAHIGNAGGQLLVYLPNSSVTQLETILGMKVSLLELSDQGAHVA